MNGYLFCTLVFILLMKNTYAGWFFKDKPEEKPKIEEQEDNRSSNEDTLTEMKLNNIKPLTGRNYTYYAAIVSKANGELHCQGALIDKRWVVTSALCLKMCSLSYDTINVIMGFHLGKVVISDIKKVYLSPDYQIFDNTNDIAIVELERSILYSGVKPIPFTRSKDPLTSTCDFVSIYNYSMVAFHVDLVSPDECMRPEIPEQALEYYCVGVAGKQIPLVEVTVLGTPLVCGGRLMGIKSLSTIFTSVPDVYDWIVDKIGHEPKTKIENDTNLDSESEEDYQPRPVPEYHNVYNTQGKYNDDEDVYTIQYVNDDVSDPQNL